MFKKDKTLVNIKEKSTDWGEGWEGEVMLGSEVKRCTIIKDKDTGEYKTLGDENICSIVADTLSRIGLSTPLSVSERLKSPSLGE